MRRSDAGRRDNGEAGRRRSDDAGRPGRPAGKGGRAAGNRDERFRGAGRAAAGREGDPRREAEPGFGPYRKADGPAGRRGGRPPEATGRRRGVDDEARTVRSVAEEAVARASGETRPALRIVHGVDGAQAAESRRRDQALKGKGARRTTPAGAAAPRPKPVRDAGRLEEALIRGARALERGYEREALRILRPWREAHPDSADLRELLGLTYYRLGRWALAQKELEAFVGLTDSTVQHPVLMDCARALGRFKRVEALWEELRAVSPGADVVTEGRIVAAGALADQGRLAEAIRLLERAPAAPKRIRPHHLRLWYVLADLHERAGDIPAARGLFRKVSAEDPAFVDVAERLAALS